MRKKILKTDINYTLRQPLVLYGLLFLVFSLIMFGGSLFIWYPVNTEYAQNKILKIAEKNKYIALLNLNKLAITYSKAKRNSEVLTSKLLPGITQSKIITNLAKITSSNHLSVKKESYNEVKMKNHVLLRHDVVINGQYKDIKKMIFDIQSLPYLAYTKNAKFEKKIKTDYVQARLVIISFLRFVDHGG
ncbi:hypothetical protein MNBD_GAMMA12-42 [hydrothermal vent metagenome]|uniref:Uncharacterized protein n=1 Tax=hydrothermal vent metagenome TaxID=652676 RepID=A0A3B0Z1C9_9ZZZZ